MNTNKNKIILIISAILIIFILIFIKEFKFNTNSYDEKIKKHLSQYSCELILLDKYKDKDGDIVYKYQTKDSEKIEFKTVVHFDVKVPLLEIKLPFMGITIDDNLKEKICENSENIKPFNTEGKTKKQIVSYIFSNTQKTQFLLKKYNILDDNIDITTTLIKNDKQIKINTNNMTEEEIINYLTQFGF